MSAKLTTAALAALQEATQQTQERMYSEDLETTRALLAGQVQTSQKALGELTRIHRDWNPVDGPVQPTPNKLYDVAGTPTPGRRPVGTGTGRYSEDLKLWFDENTHKPFPYAITHFAKRLTTVELIGQPEWDGQPQAGEAEDVTGAGV
ncbi:hypothetical protein [Hymenobacter sp. BT491]|uniref:hypothetical protein n=1 Tax=Hymenobacter sp. BT491 TaxID=2766779 RepID=UPI00165365EC|nr:hypothetical protein [Hymenobacter sp. BT491]MBC6988948.1 hypothetical protein [Hymenobacter sp. BT491]